MKKSTSLAALLALSSVSAFAEGPDLYGRAQVALEYSSEESVTELNDRASRIGIKGSEKIEGESGLEAFYQFEYGTLVDDGDRNGRTFSQRNILVGLKGSFGSIQAGKFDSPLKRAQNKFDVFNDTVVDIGRNLTDSDERPSNGVAYKTPTLGDAFKGSVAVFLSETGDDEEGKDAISTSFAYDKDRLYLGLAYDQDLIEIGSDVVRFVATYKFDNLQVGALVEQESPEEGDSTTGFGVSAKYKINKVALKGQVVSSDNVAEGLQQVTVGADYNFSKTFNLYALLTSGESDESDSEEVLAVGTVFKF